jgi:hypothetical protein
MKLTDEQLARLDGIAAEGVAGLDMMKPPTGWDFDSGDRIYNISREIAALVAEVREWRSKAHSAATSNEGRPDPSRSVTGGDEAGEGRAGGVRVRQFGTIKVERYPDGDAEISETDGFRFICIPAGVRMDVGEYLARLPPDARD